jgi:hypothetical protein
MGTLHVVTGYSAAKSLRQAIEAAGNGDLALNLLDDLSYGPINSPDVGSRAEWIEQNLAVDLRQEFDRIESTFWEPLLAWTGPLILWVSRRSTLEYSGFLEIVCRLQDRPAEVVDITDAEILLAPTMRPERTVKAETINHLPGTAFFRNDVIGRRAPLDASARKAACELWSRLRSENAPLRVFRDGELVSAPLSHFDSIIKAQAGPAWRKTRSVIGAVLGDVAYEARDFVLINRLIWLIETGQLEVRNQDPHAQDEDLPWFDWEVRLPQ